MANGVILILLLALGAVAVQAQSSPKNGKVDFKGTLEKNGYKLAAALFEIANLTEPLSNPAAVYTVLVPNDLAVEAFLKKMDLTVDDLKKRPLLAKQLAAQHIITKYNVGRKELFENGPARIVATAAGKPNSVLFRQKDDKSIKVSDVQGYVANVKKPFAIDGKKTAHPIDKVLLPDTVFYDFQDLCRFRTLTVKTFCDAVIYAGLNKTIHGEKVNATVFVPNNKAFAAGINLSGGKIPSVNETADVLKYHALEGYHTLGYGLDTSIPNNVDVPTLAQGKMLKVDYQAAKPDPNDPNETRKLPYAKATVMTTSGQQAEVIKANVHVGTAIVHGIGDVLMPGDGKTASAAATASPKPNGHRRSLLQEGWGFMGGPTAEMDDAESDIDAAVDGDESVATAADQSVLGAEELSIPGDYSQVDNGVNPW